MNKRTREAVDLFKKEADTLQRSADAMSSSTNPEIVAARGPMLTRAAHLRHLAEIAEKASKIASDRSFAAAPALLDEIDALVNEEEVEK